MHLHSRAAGDEHVMVACGGAMRHWFAMSHHSFRLLNAGDEYPLSRQWIPEWERSPIRSCPFEAPVAGGEGVEEFLAWSLAPVAVDASHTAGAFGFGVALSLHSSLQQSLPERRALTVDHQQWAPLRLEEAQEDR